MHTRMPAQLETLYGPLSDEICKRSSTAGIVSQLIQLSGICYRPSAVGLCPLCFSCSSQTVSQLDARWMQGKLRGYCPCSLVRLRILRGMRMTRHSRAWRSVKAQPVFLPGFRSSCLRKGDPQLPTSACKLCAEVPLLYSAYPQ